MKNNKSQATFAIILGIVILLLVGAAYYMYSKSSNISGNIKNNDVKSKVNDYVSSCLKSTLEDGIYSLGKTSGIYRIDEYHYYDLDGYKLPYFYENGAAKMPSIDVFQDELGLYIDTHLDYCLQGFVTLKEQGISISPGLPHTKTTISPGGVTAVMIYSITAEKSGIKYELSEFTAFREARLFETLKTVTALVKEIENNPYFVPVQVMLDETDAHDFRIDALVYTPDRFLIITIADNQTIIKGLPYVFVLFSITNMSNTAPTVDIAEPVIIKPGQRFIYRVPARDLEAKIMAFYTNDTRFPIDPHTGVIDITAPSDLKADTRLTIYVYDGELASAKSVTLRVE